MIVRNAPDWTVEVVDRFWQETASRGLGYFSEYNRQGITRVLKLAGGLGGRVLDWGCGTGALLETMVAAGAEGWGVDSSRAAVEATRARLHGRPGFGGAAGLTELTTDFRDGFFDTVTCVETVEHIDDASLGELLHSVKRMLRVGGIFLVSTPNQEDLSAAAVYCPFCDSLFHPVQHIRSWSVVALTRVLEETGFAVEFCQGIRFESFQAWSPFEGSSTEVLGVLKSNLLGRLDPLLRLLDHISRRRFPSTLEFRVRAASGRHLCAVARKRG
ncbi:MAG TPA: class I SAM-dependent methyltransferase [Thermoanaerobaculaceae bacterium]|nr:class I SAM-dependent methyltransferase [Thermoanaerobaculaceae bacterium]HPS76845.1 class I SAM-dependent methyltransferase [Thermoanaerobaculaceae bacterium]